MDLRIQQIRKKKGITQAELAVSCETTQQQIAKIESGLIDLKVSSLIKISEALNCEITDLFYTESRFLEDVKSVIKELKLNLKDISILELNAVCFRFAKIPPLNPIWEKVIIKNNKVSLKEEK